MKKLFVSLLLTWGLSVAASTGPHANPLPPAPLPPPTLADITYNSKCGAPGVGKIMQGANKNQIQRREGANKFRVNEKGYWVSNCTKPTATACAASSVASWGACNVGKAQSLPALNQGDFWNITTGTGKQPKGARLYECKSDGWSLVSSTCSN